MGVYHSYILPPPKRGKKKVKKKEKKKKKKVYLRYFIYLFIACIYNLFIYHLFYFHFISVTLCMLFPCTGTWDIRNLFLNQTLASADPTTFPRNDKIENGSDAKRAQKRLAVST